MDIVITLPNITILVNPGFYFKLIGGEFDRASESVGLSPNLIAKIRKNVVFEYFLPCRLLCFKIPNLQQCSKSGGMPGKALLRQAPRGSLAQEKVEFQRKRVYTVDSG